MLQVEKAIACVRVRGNGNMALLPKEQNEDLNPGSKWRFKNPELRVVTGTSRDKGNRK